MGPGLAPPGTGEGSDRLSRQVRGRRAATPGQPAGKTSEGLSAGRRELKNHDTAFNKKAFAGAEAASALNSMAFLSKTPKLLPCPLLQAPIVMVPVELHCKHWQYYLLLSPLVNPGKSTRFIHLQPPDSPKQNHYLPLKRDFMISKQSQPAELFVCFNLCCIAQDQRDN